MKPAWPINRIVYDGYRLIEWLSPRLPLRLVFRLARGLADLQWKRSPGLRQAVDTNLSRLLEASAEAPTPSGHEVFRNFARYLVEFFAIRRSERPALSVEGGAHLERCRAGGRGAILLTAHLGNWELGAVFIRRMGVPITVVALPHPDPRTDRLFTRQRERCGVGVIPMGTGAARRSLHSLKEGRLVGLLGDQDFTGTGLTMPFGRGSLAMPRGPAVLSLRSRAPVLPAFLIREGPWAFRLVVEPPIWPDYGNTGEAAVRSLTQRYADVMERHIRRFPEQWLMFHKTIQPLGSERRAGGRPAPATLAVEGGPGGLGASARSPEPGALCRS